MCETDSYLHIDVYQLNSRVSAPINHLEIFAILCALITFRHELRGRKVFWGVDNTTALAAVIHGYTPSASMSPLVNAVQIALAYIQCDIYFEYVPSKANPADLPSRDPDSWTLEDAKVMEDLQLTGDNRQRTMELPSVEKLVAYHNYREALRDIAQICRPDSF